YRRAGREPTDIELETLAQTWSEHCVHKTLKSRIRYREERDGETERRRDEESGGVIRGEGRPGHTVEADGSGMIGNLLKSTVEAGGERDEGTGMGIRPLNGGLYLDDG